MMWWNDGMGYAMGWGGWVLMTVVMVAFWGLVIVGIVALFRTVTTGPFLSTMPIAFTPPPPRLWAGKSEMSVRLA